MKKIFVGIILIITTIIICACGNKSDAPENVREDIWNHGIQFALFMKDTIHDDLDQNDYEKFGSAFNSYYEKFDKDATEEERKILGNLYAATLIYDIAKLHRDTMGNYNYNEEDYNDIFKALEEVFGASNLKDVNYDKDSMKKILSKYD